MEGSLEQRGKTWYLRYDVPPSPGKKREQKRVRIGKMPRANAEVRKREILRQIDEGNYQVASASMTIEAFLRSWLEATSDDHATTTHGRYTSLIEHHVLPVIGELQLVKVAPEHLGRLYRSLRGSRLSGQTCLHVHRVLDTAFVKVRVSGRIVSVAVILAVGVNTDGTRDF